MHNVEIPATNYVRVYLDSSVNGGRGVHPLLVLGSGGYFYQPWEGENRSLVRLGLHRPYPVFPLRNPCRRPGTVSVCRHRQFHTAAGTHRPFSPTARIWRLLLYLVPGLNQPNKASPRSHDQLPSPLCRGTSSPCLTSGQFPYTATWSAHRCHGVHRW